LRRGFAPSEITGRDDIALESRYHAGIGLRKCIEAARVIFPYDTDRIIIIQSPEVKTGCVSNRSHVTRMRMKRTECARLRSDASKFPRKVLCEP
jgi:hypothetical protein